MKPLRDEEHPLRELLSAASELDERDDDAARGRVRVKLFSGTSGVRSRRWPVLLLAGAVVVLAVAVLLVPSPERAPEIAPRGTSEAFAWTWVEGEVKEPATKTERGLHMGPGSLRIEATHRMEVETPRAVVETEGARFRLLVAATGTTSVWVEDGVVSVRTREKRFLVPTGAQWESESTESSDAEVHRWALELEQRGRPQDALEVLGALTPHRNAWGELALYDSARLSLKLGDREAAGRLLKAYQQRHPSGVLSDEVMTLERQIGP